MRTPLPLTFIVELPRKFVVFILPDDEPNLIVFDDDEFQPIPPKTVRSMSHPLFI
jgi:hypothetical protein